MWWSLPAWPQTENPHKSFCRSNHSQNICLATTLGRQCSPTALFSEFQEKIRMLDACQSSVDERTWRQLLPVFKTKTTTGWITLDYFPKMVTLSTLFQRSVYIGYWPSVRSRRLDSYFFGCLWTETESKSIDTQNKQRRRPIVTIFTEQAWSLKDFLYGFRGKPSRGTRRVVPSEQDSSILPYRVANQSAGFDSSCPLTELAI